jgi:hypothetical protein
LFSLPLHYRDDLKSVLIPYGLVQDRIEALASRIFSDLHIHIPEQLSKKNFLQKQNLIHNSPYIQSACVYSKVVIDSFRILYLKYKMKIGLFICLLFI